MSKAKTKAKGKTRAEFIEDLEAEIKTKPIKVYVSPKPVIQPVGGLHPRPFHKPIQSGSFRPFGGRR